MPDHLFAATETTHALDASVLHTFDIVIIGARLSDIGMAGWLPRSAHWANYAVLEAREVIGGSWDLFRYPGVRSDSDMHTLGLRVPRVDGTAISRIGQRDRPGAAHDLADRAYALALADADEASLNGIAAELATFAPDVSLHSTGPVRCQTAPPLQSSSGTAVSICCLLSYLAGLDAEAVAFEVRAETAFDRVIAARVRTLVALTCASLPHLIGAGGASRSRCRRSLHDQSRGAVRNTRACQRARQRTTLVEGCGVTVAYPGGIRTAIAKRLTGPCASTRPMPDGSSSGPSSAGTRASASDLTRRPLPRSNDRLR